MKASVSLPWILVVASAASAQTVVTRLYDYSDLSAKETVRLVETAGLVFSHAGIHVAWLHCRGAMTSRPDASCERPMDKHEISVRLYPGAPPTTEDWTPRLGWTLLGGREGCYSTVYLQSVRRLASEWSISFDLLAAYAAAHEIGHCLLGAGHSSSGLMRAVWTRKDSEEMTRISLGLTKQEARKAAERLEHSQIPARKG